MHLDMASQSDLDPMITDTNGFTFVIGAFYQCSCESETVFSSAARTACKKR